MHNVPVNYIDFNGNPQQRVLYFNLSEAEITKIQKDYLHLGGIQVVMNEAIASGETKKLLDFFELLVRQSYGIKSDDGQVFRKNAQIWEDFENSAWYSDLYMSFFKEEGQVGSRFINAVLPKHLIEQAEKNVQGEGDLARAAEAAAAFRPDARQQFEERRAQLQDHLPKQQPTQEAPQIPQQPYQVQEGTPVQPSYVPQEIREKTSPLYQPTQPDYPQVPQQEPMRQPAQPEEAQHNIQRPPHESGPGYNLGNDDRPGFGVTSTPPGH